MLSRAAVAVVLAASLPLPIQAHDIYSHLKDKLGTSCCDNRDCQLAPYRFIANGLQMFVDKRWIEVPSDKIQYGGARKVCSINRAKPDIAGTISVKHC